MSSYENYSQTSAAYDQTRVPIGIDIITRGFALGNVPLEEMVVLDAGCGTGSYSRELLRFVDRIDAVDLNSGMLQVATTKLHESHKTGRAAFHCAALAELPFADASFDGIMVNQVLHHLDGPGSIEFPEHRRALLELTRVLRPGGALVINTSSRQQIRQAFWNSALIPEVAERMAECFMPVTALERLIIDCGQTIRGRFISSDAMQGTAYFDARGALSKPWRDGDSFWAKATEAELHEALQRIRGMDQNGTLEAYVASHEAARLELGQATFVVAVR